MTEKTVRVRFAPSPTGSLHIGGARTALFNWLFARHSGGSFILRIEDTDQARTLEGSYEEILSGLRWLGIDWDEGPDIGGAYGPYIQSQRIELYQKWAHYLVERGRAYRCYATQAELEHAKQVQQQKTGKRAGYERLHRFLSDEERERLHKERHGQYVIRLAMPIEGTTTVYDVIRGEITFPNEELSDIVLLKADGFPTYHLAMAVDDHLMEISHVMRSDEWTPSLPMHLTLYEAFGWEPPTFVHLPIMVYKGKKISKRNPPISDEGKPIPIFVRQYQEAGYQPEAVVNWLATIGWYFGEEREIFSVQEAIERFTLDRINPSPTEMPFSKLEFLNGHYVRTMSDADFRAALKPLLEAEYGAIDEEKLDQIIPHIKGRVNPLHHAVPLVRFLFASDFQPPSAEQLIQKNMDAAATKAVLQRSYEVLDSLPDFRAETQESAMRKLVAELGMKAGQVFNPLRWAVTCQQVSPPLFESMEVLGKETSLTRLKQAIEVL